GGLQSAGVSRWPLGRGDLGSLFSHARVGKTAQRNLLVASSAESGIADRCESRVSIFESFLGIKECLGFGGQWGGKSSIVLFGDFVAILSVYFDTFLGTQVR